MHSLPDCPHHHMVTQAGRQARRRLLGGHHQGPGALGREQAPEAALSGSGRSMDPDEDCPEGTSVLPSGSNRSVDLDLDGPCMASAARAVTRLLILEACFTSPSHSMNRSIASCNVQVRGGCVREGDRCTWPSSPHPRWPVQLREKSPGKRYKACFCLAEGNGNATPGGRQGACPLNRFPCLPTMSAHVNILDPHPHPHSPAPAEH